MTLLVDVHHVGLRQTGNETWARNVARELAKIAKPNEVAYAGTATGADEVFSATGVRPHLVSKRSSARLGRDLPRLARGLDAQALLVHYTMPLSRKPCVVVIHDLSFEDRRASDWLPPATRRRMQASARTSARFASHLLVPSEFTRRQIIDLYDIPADRVSVAANAVDPSLASHIATRRENARRRNGVTVLTVGSLLPRKNLGMLGRAVAQLRHEGIDAQLRVVGTVPKGGRYVAKSLVGSLGDTLTITGYLPTEQLAGEYAAADVFCLPSLYEGFGIPILEAMTAGVPAVVSDRAALPEVAGEAALIVDADVPQAWATAIKRVVTDRAVREKLTKIGVERACASSWRETADIALDALRCAATIRLLQSEQPRG